MWAGGDCVSTGYLANPILDADRYRPDPFLGGGRRMFRTRDLGRWTPEGQLEHLGRTDDQVKVRGFRVELDSVSRILESTPGCNQAVALKLDDKTLVAFVAPADVDVIAARDAAAARLPYYAVPAKVHALPSLPLTSRGKIDKRQLLAFAGGVS
jgi:acyl-coenzyme A synthetase/AMP-(fatty) acid ligase